jgi:hypothetical protein
MGEGGGGSGGSRADQGPGFENGHRHHVTHSVGLHATAGVCHCGGLQVGAPGALANKGQVLQPGRCSRGSIPA